MRAIIIILLMGLFVGCEQIPDPVPDNTWFMGSWKAVENQHDQFTPTGIVLTDSGHVPDPEFKTGFNFFKEDDRYCFVSRSRIQINGWEGVGLGQSYKWSYSGEVLKLESYMGSVRFEVDFTSRTAMTLMDLETGETIKLEGS